MIANYWQNVERLCSAPVTAPVVIPAKTYMADFTKAKNALYLGSTL